MEVLRWKTRIAVLWVAMAVFMSAHAVMRFMEPGIIEGIMSGQMEGEALTPAILVFFSIFFVVPLWLAFATMTVKGSSNRWVNFVLGIVFTVLNIWLLTEWLASPAQILIVGSTVAVTALIVVYAWKWPKQEA